ncbi:cysteine desulfurase family protein [Paenibacillus turpanensis]|uniref:cysteine desulfurase family protein n=1 Tax=Paenibacillus turpanensis TaxID=2689078 RepID=UPI00140C5FA5|nr:cysteine desulfurase family protein [Paenibacillus turpanensis]
MDRIYLDHAASTPMRSEVVEALLPHMMNTYGNPSSLHSFGREAKAAVTASRDRIADLLGCNPSELVFTSGGTESDNLAVIGAARAAGRKGKKHVVTTQIEHHAVLHACRALEAEGFEVTYIPADSYGRIEAQAVADAIRPDTALISVMVGNNEVGTLQPIEEIGALARERGVLFHSDAVQALGYVDLQLNKLPVDLMSFSAHKINGPKGIGALYISRNVSIAPTLFGGSQEKKRRAGTENVAGAVGFAKAVELAVSERTEHAAQMRTLRDQMCALLGEQLPEGSFTINGHPDEEHRLPHILNVSFPGLDTETLLMNLDLEGIAAASGSACSSGSLELSHVLRAMCLPDEVARSAVRFSFGHGSCLKIVTITARKLATITKRLTYK